LRKEPFGSKERLREEEDIAKVRFRGIERWEYPIDAIRKVKIAIDLWIETAKKENREIPKPLEKEIEIKPDTTGENMKLEFLLFKNDELYRDLHLWINVSE